MSASLPAYRRTDSALQKLVEMSAQLRVQEAALIEQLASLQAKRQSLKTAIDLFTAGGAVAAQELAEMQTSPVASESVLESVSNLPLNTLTKPKKRSAVKPGKTSQTIPNWKRYIAAEFGKTPLPKIVKTVLQQQPDVVLEIQDVVDAIFNDAIPDAAYSIGYGRISNILSQGVREGKWYRSKPGCYSLAKGIEEVAAKVKTAAA
ncbi:MAG: hypothetical protein F6K19_12105 [Cyanothece sp. SIO1E1]|nr:hypothetical protein [Cyanothece sp. SIO1E1]